MDAPLESQKPTDTADVHDARERLGRLPGFTPDLARDARITRLVGMTNRVYEVAAGDRHLCLRIPGGGAAAAIDRRTEEVNARAAARAGVAPDVLYFGNDGVMLTRFIEGSTPLRPERLRSTAGALERVAAAFRRLHASGEAFAGRFRAFDKIGEYSEALRRLDAPLSGSDRAAIERLEEISRALAARPRPFKPCHCDPTGRNLLDTGEKVWLVDWEYSGMNDPLWDLGDLSVEGRFDADQDEELMRAYFDGEARPAERGRVVIYKAMCDLLWTLWGIIQHVNQNPVDDFWAYAVNRFERCKKLMGSAEFGKHLQAVRDG